MATNLAIDNELIELAKKIGNHRTKKEAVIHALKAYIDRKRQMEILDVMGTIDYDSDYDYKEQRKRK